MTRHNKPDDKQKPDPSIVAAEKLARNAAQGYRQEEPTTSGMAPATLFFASGFVSREDNPSLYVNSHGDITKDKPSDEDVALRQRLAGEHLRVGRIGAPDFSNLPFGKAGKREVLEKFAGKGNEAGIGNLRGFLDTIAYAEGTLGRGKDKTGENNGYDVKVGYGQIHSYQDHPRDVVELSPTLRSSAAGRYQFLSRTWDGLAKKLNLQDFSPNAQDAAALELVREAGALQDVLDGKVEQALQKCKGIWASLPGAGYGQPERQMDTLLRAYEKAGGKFENDTRLARKNVPKEPQRADYGDLKERGAGEPPRASNSGGNKPIQVTDAPKGGPKLTHVTPKGGGDAAKNSPAPDYMA